MTTIADTALGKLDSEHRLLNAVVSQPSTKAPGRYVFRGEIAIKLAEVREHEKRPPEIKAEQAILSAVAGQPYLQFASFFFWDFSLLKPTVELLAPMLSPEGRYIAFVNNIDLGAAYTVPFGDVVFYVLPLDESTVYNELLELLRIEKNDLKKLDAAGKLDAIVDGAKKIRGVYERISFERGLELMGPVKDPSEGRPV
jgi:hypothetical protein